MSLIPPGCTRSVLNYDPRARHTKDNFLLTFLMPPKLPTKCAQKFYDLLVDELENSTTQV